MLKGYTCWGKPKHNDVMSKQKSIQLHKPRDSVHTIPDSSRCPTFKGIFKKKEKKKGNYMHKIQSHII